LLKGLSLPEKPEETIRMLKTCSRFASFLLAASCAIATTGCGSDDDAGDTEPSGQVNLFSWWTSGGEVDALRALIAVHEQRYPKTKVKNLAEDLADQARARLAQLMEAGTPPDLYQANVGADEFTYVLYNGVDDRDSRVESLDALAEKEGWTDVFPPAVLDALSYNGTIYAVPANIHRINSLFYNKKIMEEEGLDVPETTDDLLTTAEALKSAGYTPLCIGASDSWTVALLLFENILPAVAGGDYYMSYWTGKEKPKSDEMRASLDYFHALWPYFNEDAGDLDWTAGVDHMFDDDAPCVMTVMGDWAKGYLTTKGWTAGEEFDQAPFPGSNGTFVFTADTFPLPKGAPNRDGAVAFLKTVGSIEGQVAFNLLKGSIPVRTDVDPMEFDETTRRTMADFAQDNLVTARSGLVPADAFADLPAALQDLFREDDDSVVLNSLANDYDALRACHR
jgi:glucose/mannose transport system substrate-binding protein